MTLQFRRIERAAVGSRLVTIIFAIAALLFGLLPAAHAQSTWLNDPFDNLRLGALSGQNGWICEPSHRVVYRPGGGRMLRMDPPPGGAFRNCNDKDVPDQSGGFHLIQFDVQAVNAGEASLAKLEVKCEPKVGGGYDKRFQIYAGTGMRVNYGPTSPEAFVFLDPAVSGQWYRVLTIFDLREGVGHIHLASFPRTRWTRTAGQTSGTRGASASPPPAP